MVKITLIQKVKASKKVRNKIDKLKIGIDPQSKIANFNVKLPEIDPTLDIKIISISYHFKINFGWWLPKVKFPILIDSKTLQDKICFEKIGNDDYDLPSYDQL